MRRLSPHLTRLLIPTSLTANGLTALMVPMGLLAALALSFGGVWTAVVSVLLVQLQLLLDCADGELARWRRTFSPAGVYLDQIAHYTTEAALPAALGVRADGGWDSIGGWTAVGLAASALIVLLKAETHLVLFARVRAGVEPVEAPDEEHPPVRAQRLRVREGARLLPFFRPFHAIEATLLALAAAIADAASGELAGSRLLVALLASGALVAAAGHLAAVLASNRLR